MLPSRTVPQLSTVAFWASCVIFFVLDSLWKQTTAWLFAEIEKKCSRIHQNIIFYGWNITQTITTICIINFDDKRVSLEFHCHRTRRRNAECSGHPTELATLKRIEKNPRIGVGRTEIESARDVVWILHDHFGIRKLSPIKVPCLLTIDHNRIRVTSSKELLKHNLDELLRRFIAMDETWTITHRRSSSGFLKANRLQRRSRSVCSQQNHCDSFLGWIRSSLPRLSSKRKNIQWPILCQFSEPVQPRF